MSPLQQAMATLRITLAEIQNKERQLDSMVNQFRLQLRRLPRQVIYGNTPLDVSLSAMGEIEERLADSLAARRRLLAIKKTTLEELEALELVKQVDEARRSLSKLQSLLQLGSGEDAATLEEVHRLEQFIAEHSKRAELAITASYRERQQAG
jgi:hypothetical protein